ncbi:PREDICTED: uncharacterized protein LOC109480323 [Branchiostoma belcheri]|uniref:Uncharacterized protein LOC109480323 n=1 Tax=Branchiostoma belcheri TaxID=7741 RepID=A0A6P5A4D9_BRABE|nr:PREDICTED: uncharacterized protein LOC109480323 [Branchiostoma belcheri]
MGNKHPNGVNTGSEEHGESTSQTIRFDKVYTRVMRNPFPEYEGLLIEKSGQNGQGTGKVVRTDRLTPGNKHKVVVLVYTYKCTSDVNGTYVVLQFNQSEKYFAAHKNKPDKLILKKAGWTPENAEDITTTSDRRVFLMTPNQLGSRDLVFSSRGSRHHVISVFQNIRRFAELEDQGTGTAIESQLFQLDFPEMRRAHEDSESTKVTFLEIVPFPFKPLGGADEQSDQDGDETEKLSC